MERPLHKVKYSSWYGKVTKFPSKLNRWWRREERKHPSPRAKKNYPPHFHYTSTLTDRVPKLKEHLRTLHDKPHEFHLKPNTLLGCDKSLINGNGSFLLRGNVTSHVAQRTLQKPNERGYEAHPPYSPNFPPTDSLSMLTISCKRNASPLPKMASMSLSPPENVRWLTKYKQTCFSLAKTYCHFN